MNKKIIVIFLVLSFFIFQVSAKDFLIRNESDITQTYFGVFGSSGNVGVGTNEPVNPLDVNGKMSVSDNAYYKSSANLGDFQYSFATKDYVDRLDTNDVYLGNLTWIDSDDQGDLARGVWGDGKFIYLANDAGGLHTYSVNNDGYLTHIDMDDQGGTAYCVWGDGKFIYLADDTGGLHTYSVDNEGYLTHIDSDYQGYNAYGVWGDGKFIYLANGYGGLYTYSVNSTGGLAYIDSDYTGSPAYGVWGDGKFIYLANYGGGLLTYSVNSTGGLTLIDSDNQGYYSYSVWGDGKFIYVANNDGGIYSYSVNSTGGLTLRDSDNQGFNARGVFGDGNFIYLAYSDGGLHTYSVNSTGGLTNVDRDDQGDYGMGVWGDGKFIYLANYGGGIHSYKLQKAYEFDKENSQHYFHNYVGIGYTNPIYKIQLDSDTYGTDTGWTDSSDRNKKENFQPLSNLILQNVKLGKWNGNDAIEYDEDFVNLTNEELLNRLELLPITHWNFIEEPGIFRIGPMAQDFYKMFGLGRNDTQIKATDMAGVALAGVKAEGERIDSIKEKNQEIQNKLNELLKEVENLG